MDDYQCSFEGKCTFLFTALIKRLSKQFPELKMYFSQINDIFVAKLKVVALRKKLLLLPFLSTFHQVTFHCEKNIEIRKTEIKKMYIHSNFHLHVISEGVRTICCLCSLFKALQDELLNFLCKSEEVLDLYTVLCISKYFSNLDTTHFGRS